MIADRIKDVWGPRTPHAPGEEWPARVDLYLQEGLAESDVEWHQSACVLCSNGCGVDIAVQDGRMVGVRGREVDRVNHGRLGPKGLFGWQANHSADRLTTPLVRQDGQLRPASWDEAMRLVVERSREVLRRHGPLGLVSSRRAAVPRGLLHPRHPGAGRHRDATPRRQHSPVHGHGRLRSQGDVRHRRGTRQPRGLRPVRHPLPGGAQHGRDPHGALVEGSGPSRRPGTLPDWWSSTHAAPPSPNARRSTCPSGRAPTSPCSTASWRP